MGAYFLYNIYVAFYENKSIVYIIKMDCGKNVSHYFSHFSHSKQAETGDFKQKKRAIKNAGTIEIPTFSTGGEYGARTRDLMTASHYVFVYFSTFTAIVSHYFSRASRFKSSDLVDIIFNKCLASSSVSSDSWV